MSPSALRDIFGVTAPWVATALLVLLAGVFTAAFAQGREVTFWPPRIGPRPQRTPSPNAAAQPTDVDPELALPVPRQPARTLTSPYDQEFDAHHARDFYHEVASVYDTRNSGNLVSTHLAAPQSKRSSGGTSPAISSSARSPSSAVTSPRSVDN